MGWKLAMLGLVVCGATVFAVSRVIEDHAGSVLTDASTSVTHPPKHTVTAHQRPHALVPTASPIKQSKRSPKSMPPATRMVRPQDRATGDGPLDGQTISVDPGHNGGNATHPEEIGRFVPAGAFGTTKPCNTTGTETNSGSLTEAQFNWDVAQDLVPRLEHLGAKVVLTRHSNDGVGPCVDKRAEIANRAGADVAVSIHADGNLAARAHGFDVIHASTAEMVAPETAVRSGQLAEAERNALIAAGVPPANYVGADGLDERSDLAGLNLAEVPAVLVELGNMREEEEAAQLESPAYRRKLADALATGIVSFLDRS